MIPQNGVQDTATRPLPPELLVVILVISLLVIGVFSFAIAAFIRAGQRDSAARRRRGADAKDPLDPHLPVDKNES